MSRDVEGLRVKLGARVARPGSLSGVDTERFMHDSGNLKLYGTMRRVRKLALNAALISVRASPFQAGIFKVKGFCKNMGSSPVAPMLQQHRAGIAGEGQHLDVRPLPYTRRTRSESCLESRSHPRRSGRHRNPFRQQLAASQSLERR